MLNDPSTMSIKSKIGVNDGIRSTKAFLTSVTPSKAIANAKAVNNTIMNEDLSAANLGFLSDGNNSPTGAGATNKRTKRKIFGAKDYLERKK